MPAITDTGGGGLTSPTVSVVTDEQGREVVQDCQVVTTGGTPAVTLGPWEYGPTPAEAAP